MSVTKSRHDPWQLFGLSTDVKWTDSEMPVGSKFHATDTNTDYIWSGTAWETFTLATGAALSATAEVTGTLTISSGSVTLAATAQVTGTLTVSGNVSVQGAKTPTIYNVSCTAGDTEYSQAVTSTATRFGLSTQTGASTATIRIAFATSQVTAGGTALQITADSEYYEDKLSLTGNLTVYFAVSTAAQTVQIIAWS